MIPDSDSIIKFKEHLIINEKSAATIEKYIRDVKAFFAFAGKSEITKETVIAYKNKLIEAYKPRSVNSMLASLNAFFTFCDMPEMKSKELRVQKDYFCNEERELTRAEYERLCAAAEKKNHRLALIMQTVCATGIRISELQFITVDSVKRGEITVLLKGKTRRIFIVKNLKRKLLEYIKKQKIKSGYVFITKNGKPLNRSNIWKEMKAICADAGVNEAKVFPHNLRHLFARIFYGIEKDIAKLADILGHSSINTTRIYIIDTGNEHRKKMEKMKLVI